jgi:hypothetical protein
VFDKKKKRQGKEEEKKWLIKKQITPLFFIFSLSLSHLHLVLLTEIKKNFRTVLCCLDKGGQFSLKYEEVYLKSYKTLKEARNEINIYKLIILKEYIHR